jgi:hypothetical protein
LADRDLFGAAPSAARTSVGCIPIVCGR